jgi:hypothetical protein
MNLYLLLAIAFGAVTGAAQAPAVRPSVILSRADGEGSQVRQREILRSAQADGSDSSRSVARRPAANVIRVDAPLTGAASPRAPATIG